MNNIKKKTTELYTKCYKSYDGNCEDKVKYYERGCSINSCQPVKGTKCCFSDYCNNKTSLMRNQSLNITIMIFFCLLCFIIFFNPNK